MENYVYTYIYYISIDPNQKKSENCVLMIREATGRNGKQREATGSNGKQREATESLIAEIYAYIYGISLYGISLYRISLYGIDLHGELHKQQQQ